MTQGIFINGRRPASKKEIKEYLEGIYTNENDPFGLVIEATSMFGNEFDGSIEKAERSILADGYIPENEGPPFPAGKGITFVGPDPYTSRKFYGQIKWNANKERFVVS